MNYFGRQNLPNQCKKACVSKVWTALSNICDRGHMTLYKKNSKTVLQRTIHGAYFLNVGSAFTVIVIWIVHLSSENTLKDLQQSIRYIKHDLHQNTFVFSPDTRIYMF